MGSVPISTRTINHFIIIKLNPVKSLMGTDPISPRDDWNITFSDIQLWHNGICSG